MKIGRDELIQLIPENHPAFVAWCSRPWYVKAYDWFAGLFKRGVA